MTWMAARQIRWHELPDEGMRIKVMRVLVRSNPVLNGTAAAYRDLGNATDIEMLRRNIIRSGEELMMQFQFVTTEEGSALLQRALLSMITEKLVGSHLRRMLDNDDHDSTRRGYYVPGLVHYPAQFYLAKVKPDGSVEYFTDSNTRLAHRDSIYAEFYGEFTEFRTKASAQGKGAKRRRPVVIFDDKTFPRFRAVPCSTAGGDVRIRFVGHFSFKPSYTVHRFPVDLKPCMVEDDPDAYPILAVTLKDLDRVLTRFEE